MKKIFELLSEIRPADQKAMEAARLRWNSVAKPIGSLGILEEDIIKIAGILGNAERIPLEKSALAVMCADHGVVEEGVTQTGQEVTRIVAENFTKGQTSVTCMCRVSGTDVFPVDVGMTGEGRLWDGSGKEAPAPFVLLNRRAGAGSRNLVREAAMTGDQCERALLAGAFLARDLKQMGYGILASGEMGIGNTTPASALASVLTGASPRLVTGRGAGLSDQGLLRKQKAVEAACERFFRQYPRYKDFSWEASAEPRDALLLLTELGGFDIAAMAGLFLGAAAYRLPAVIDGFISSAAALLAVLMCRDVKDFLLASHVSSEPGGRLVMDQLGLKAPLDCGMHLGEGSGAVALLPLLKMGAMVYENMSTFSEIHVESYVDYGAKKGGRS